MKIVVLTMAFLPERARGTEIASYHIAKSLAKKGHEVTVITSGSKRVFEKDVRGGFFVSRILYPKIPFFGTIIFWLKVPFLIRKIKPDIVHCQSTQMGLPGFFYKKIFKIPYVVCGQGSDIYLRWRFKRIIHKLVFNNAAAIVALTEDMKKRIQENCKKDIFLIPSGIDLNSFKGLSKDASRRKLGLDTNKKIIIFVGALEAVKGIKYLIDSMKTVRGEISNAILLVVGVGRELQHLEKLARENNLEKEVYFVGGVPHNRVFEYMIASDVLALPSLSEGFPLVILEGMAAGLPIIATNVTGISEIVKNGQHGFLVESKNSAQIAKSIILLFSDGKLRECIGLNNVKKSKEYSWDIIVEELLKIYYSCLAV